MWSTIADEVACKSAGHHMTLPAVPLCALLHTRRPAVGARPAAAAGLPRSSGPLYLVGAAPAGRQSNRYVHINASQSVNAEVQLDSCCRGTQASGAADLRHVLYYSDANQLLVLFGSSRLHDRGHYRLKVLSTVLRVTLHTRTAIAASGSRRQAVVLQGFFDTTRRRGGTKTGSQGDAEQCADC